jgi:hypothetical protein
MSVNLNLSETVMSAVAAKLAAQMPIRVSTINAALPFGDPATIQPPAQILVDHINEIQATPTLIVAEGPTLRPEWEGTHGFIAPIQIVVVIYEEAVDRQTLVMKLRRQARAVVESIWDGDPVEMLGPPAADGTTIRPTGINPGPLGGETATQLGGWRSVRVVTFLAKQLEGI